MDNNIFALLDQNYNLLICLEQQQTDKIKNRPRLS
jgi:hypothetical protein